MTPETPAGYGLRLFTLGEAALKRPDGEVVLGPSKQLALLVYLASAPARTAARSTLIRLLWTGDRPTGSDSGPLRTLLTRLKDSLGPDLSITKSHVSLASEIGFDRDDFVSAVDGGDHLAALALYRGPFVQQLAHPTTADFEHWADIERTRLEHLFLHTGEGLFRALLEEGKRREALGTARQVRTAVPDAELGWRMVLEALAGGSRLEALAEAEAFEHWIRGMGRDPEPMTAALLTDLRELAVPADDAVPSTGTFTVELVGRQEEFAQLTRAWRRVGHGPAGLVHITAPPGFGKTRLLTDFAGRLRVQNHRVVQLNAVAGERNIQYSFASHLALALGRLPGSTGIPLPQASVLVGLQPSLSARYPAASPVGDQHDLPNQRLLALSELIAAVAEEQPFALLLDDLHWADRASRELLGAIVTRLGDRKILVVTAARPIANTDAPPDAVHLTLRRLTVADVEELVSSMGTLPSGEWAGHLAPALQRAADGSPFFVLASLRLAMDQGLLALRDGIWTSAAPDTLLAHLAETNALEQRIREAEPDLATVLLVLAVAGTALDTPGLATASSMTSTRLDTSLRQAERAGYVQADGGSWQLPHDEIGRIVLESADPARVTATHRALGHLLASEPAPTRVRMRRAAAHLTEARDEPGLAALLTRWIRTERARGYRLTVPTHAADLLEGTGATDRAGRLVAALPARLRLERWRPHALVAAAALVAAPLVALAVTAEPEPIDAYLMAAVPDIADGAIELRRFPVSDARLARADRIRLRALRRSTRPPGATGRYFEPPTINGLGYSAKTEFMADSGGLDLFLRAPDGQTRRLTNAPGDDVQASWSPDGRYLAFSTPRWSTASAYQMDIAVLNVSTGTVHRVTTGVPDDGGPSWAPSGVMIGYTRHAAGRGDSLCWTTVDGAAGRCLATGGQTLVAGWRRQRLLATTRVDGAAAARLVEWDPASDSVRTLPFDVGPGPARVDPTGRWIASRDWHNRQPVLVDLDRGGSRHIFAAEPAAALFWAPEGPRVRYLERLLMAQARHLFLGVTHTLAATAVDTEGLQVEFPATIVTWTSRDPSIVRVVGERPMAVPRRPGQTWIVASAGGWRIDSALVTVAPQEPPALIHREDWSDTSLAQWRFQGQPAPRVVREAGGRRALLVDGDSSFFSGAFSAAGFDARSGLALVARLSTKVTTDVWQVLKLMLTTGPVATVGGITSAASGACTLRVPAAAPGGVSRIAMGGAELPAPGQVLTGSWYTAVIQVFPDGTCGYAIDGVAMFRSAPEMNPDDPVHVAADGQSVRTRMLLGPFQVWRGIYPGVDWHSLER